MLIRKEVKCKIHTAALATYTYIYNIHMYMYRYTYTRTLPNKMHIKILLKIHLRKMNTKPFQEANFKCISYFASVAHKNYILNLK